MTQHCQQLAATVTSPPAYLLQTSFYSLSCQYWTTEVLTAGVQNAILSVFLKAEMCMHGLSTFFKTLNSTMHTFSSILRILKPLCCILIHKIANSHKKKKKKAGFFQQDDILAQPEWQRMCFDNWYSCMDTAIGVSRECPE